jgi:hypothetical protein
LWWGVGQERCGGRWEDVARGDVGLGKLRAVRVGGAEWRGIGQMLREQESGPEAEDQASVRQGERERGRER